MKLMGMKPINDKRNHCYEAVKVTIANWWGLEYQPIYYKSWGFDHIKKQPNNSDELLGNRIYNGSEIFDETNIKIGMRINEIYYSNQNQLKESIVNGINNNAPLIINMDAYDCPFHPVYKKQHLSHDFIVVGIKDNLLICLDPKFHLTHQKLSLDTIKEKDIKISIAKKTQTSPISNYKHLIREALKQQINKDITTFDSIKGFALEVREGIDMERELRGYPLNTAPLIFQLSNTQYNREKFSIFLSFINSKSNSPKIQIAINITNQLSKKWKTVENLILKSAFQKDSQSIFVRISDRILEIYELERKLYSTLSNYARSSENEYN